MTPPRPPNRGLTAGLNVPGQARNKPSHLSQNALEPVKQPFEVLQFHIGPLAFA